MRTGSPRQQTKTGSHAKRRRPADIGPATHGSAADDSRAASAAASFAPALLSWFRLHGRHDLPWQRDPTPYRVWVSEVMLQQTQVATVIPYFERFMTSFPTVADLARAASDEVLHHWSGLGYYARARNLHRAARIVVAEHAGEVPAGIDALMALPGLGRSTAAAILALSRGERHPILDGNVKRVLARWFAVDGFPGDARIASRLWALSELVTPPDHAAEFTQAAMDLGATLCTRTKPACERCPVAPGCRARASGRAELLPARRPPRVRPVRRVYWLVLTRGTHVLLERRPESGIWGGLWSFPEFESRALVADALRRDLGASAAAKRLSVAPMVRHAFTHFELEAIPVVAATRSTRAASVEGVPRTWYNSCGRASIGLAAPVAAFLAAFAAPAPVQRSRA
jgi:A/G-specific adenine glycosylase